MDQQNKTQTPNILTPEQTQDLFAGLGLEGISDEKKQQMMDTMIDTVLNRIFTRISAVLTDEDEKMIADLELRPEEENAVYTYLAGRVPNLDAIAQEEVNKLKEELKTVVSTIKEQVTKNQN